MNEFKGYRNGVDLGGWLSQCGYEKEHIESFITEADIARIASWGCDHVRLPFDYNIILDDSGNVLESGLKLLERCADWCGVPRFMWYSTERVKVPSYSENIGRISPTFG